MATTLCDFDLRLHLCADGLMGGDREYNPYFKVHATFGDYKVKDLMALQLVDSQPRQLRPYQGGGGGEELYEYDDKLNTYRSAASKNFRLEHSGVETRVDESVNVELWCHTRLSGIKELDKRESRYAERQVSCGLFQLSVAQVIALYKQNGLTLGRPFLIEASIVDDKIVDACIQEYARSAGVQQLTRELYQRYVGRAIEETHKGRVKFELCMNQFSEALYTGSVFHIRDFQARTCMATAFGASAFGASGGLATMPTDARHRRQRPSEPPPRITFSPSDRDDVDYGPGGVTTISSSKFEPLSHTSLLGYQKMQECMQQCVLATYCRTFMKLEAGDPEPLYGPADQVVKNLHFPQWISKMGKGLAISYFSCHDPSTRVYTSEQARLADLQRYGFTAKTEEHMLQLARSAIRSRGLSEAQFEQTVREHFSLKNQSRTLAPLFALCEEVVARLGTFAANSAYYTSDYRMVRRLARGNVAKMIVLDSWDNTILNDSGRSDDCEGQDNTATTIIRAFGTGRYDRGFRWESGLLDAIQLYLRHTVIYDVGGTVTSAFVDNSNQAVDLHKAELPMNDDAMDLRSKSDGHCFGLMESQSNCLKRLAQGNLGAERVAQMRRSGGAHYEEGSAFLARDALRGVLVLEGTGTIEPRILPLDESYEGNQAVRDKKLAERQFVKAVQMRMKERSKQQPMVDISGMFHGEGMPHYVAKQHPQRRISDFYKQPVMGCSVELYQRFGIAGSQFAFTRRGDDGKYRYGVKIADFMRTTERYALIFPFAKCSAEWQQRVTQLTECVQHQLPLMAFGRYSEQQHALLHSRYERGSLEGGAPAFEALVAQVATSRNLALARLQTRPGELELDPAKTEAMFDFLEAQPGLVAYGVYDEHQLPICDSIKEILCVVDKDVCLQQLADHQ
jgi:hypothetical protein